jgi:hypothetical protein
MAMVVLIKIMIPKVGRVGRVGRLQRLAYSTGQRYFVIYW